MCLLEHKHGRNDASFILITGSGRSKAWAVERAHSAAFHSRGEWSDTVPWRNNNSKTTLWYVVWRCIFILCSGWCWEPEETEEQRHGEICASSPEASYWWPEDGRNQTAKPKTAKPQTAKPKDRRPQTAKPKDARP